MLGSGLGFGLGLGLALTLIEGSLECPVDTEINGRYVCNDEPEPDVEGNHPIISRSRSGSRSRCMHQTTDVEGNHPIIV